MRTAPVRPLISLPALAAVGIFVFGLMNSTLFADGDPYWHVAVGRWIVAHRAIPVRDVFSHSAPGIPWTAHEWLSEVVMFAVWQAAGWRGIQLLISAMFALTAGYILRFLADRMQPVHAIPAGLLCLALMNEHFLGRPHVLVWPLTAVWVGTLVASGESRRPPPWWLLLLLPVWSNLHASFTMALGFAGALAIDAILQFEAPAERVRAARAWVVFLIASFACVLINPRGLGAITHASGVMQLKATLDIVKEWQSADFHQLSALMIWLLAILAIAFSGRLRLSVMRTLLVAGLLYLALKHQRYHATIGLATPFLLATPLAIGLRREADASSDRAAALDRWFARLTASSRKSGVAIAVGVSIAFAVILRPDMPIGPMAATTPERALAAFQATGVQGRVLNGYVIGGYLIFRDVPVFIDGRGDMYGDAFMVEARDAFGLRRPHALEDVLTKYHIAWTMLPPKTAAVELLDHLPAWERLYADSVAIVHVRRDLLHAARPGLSPPTHQ